MSLLNSDLKGKVVRRLSLESHILHVLFKGNALRIYGIDAALGIRAMNKIHGADFLIQRQSWDIK